eukprot:294718-Pelagomonas_calceolata.AAC.1
MVSTNASNTNTVQGTVCEHKEHATPWLVHGVLCIRGLGKERKAWIRLVISVFNLLDGAALPCQSNIVSRWRC